MTAQQAFEELRQSLYSLYDKRESENIADWVIETITQEKRWQRRNSPVQLLPKQEYEFIKYQKELLQHRPVQYVLGEAWFCGMKFFVNEHVLIPRPETEELVDLLVKDHSGRSPLVIDIGTGSGCIPISIRNKLNQSRVISCDISEGAIEVAKKNAIHLKAEVDFRLLDFLDESNWSSLPDADIIVSNPPYIPFDEKELLAKNVVDFEPSVALFVPEKDPLIFYKAIVHFAENKLAQDGKIYLEANETFAEKVAEYFRGNGFTADIHKDLFGKERFVTIIWNSPTQK